MKKKILCALAMVLSLGVVGCASEPVYEDFSDSYVDALPEKSEDGVTFHAFCWTYNQIKENLPYLANSGFKNVLTMPAQQPKNGGSSWWAYYQPVSFSIADNSAIGTKEDLKSLCEEADKYHISIMVDVVANHMANMSDEDLESDGTPKVSPSVESYEPILYRNRNANVDGVNGVTFHHNKNAQSSGAETQYYEYGKLPDLNTANPYVQSRVLSYLKECIDVGVDGFRFDAAKHIETEKDPSYASDFWNNTLEVAKTYYNEKTGKNLYSYGEVLNAPKDRDVSVYTSHMRVTDDGYCSQFKGAFASKKASQILNAQYSKGSGAKDLVAWVESHDEYVSASNHYGDARIARLWSVLASRKDLGSLYLGRPDADNTVGNIGNYSFETEYVACANRFHNRFVGADEYLSVPSEMIFVNERVGSKDQGALILNLDTAIKTDENVSVALPHLDDGNYYDSITGNKVVVTNHKANIKFEVSGISILTRTNNKEHPRFTISERTGSFVTDKEITITPSHIEEGYYTFNDETERHTLTGETKISIKDHVTSNNKVTINIVLKNGNNTLTRSFTYNKIALIEGGFNVINLNPKYLTDYELYMWSWSPSVWTKNYRVQDGVILVDTTGMTGFLFGLFEKGYTIPNPSAWDSNVIKQSADIKGASLQLGFYDASNF